MLPPTQIRLQARNVRLHHWLAGAATAAFVLLSSPAMAQEAPAEPNVTSTASTAEAPIAFEADSVSYAYDDEVVTASGNVFLRRDDQSVRADKVVWNRKSGQITASGNVRLVDSEWEPAFHRFNGID